LTTFKITTKTTAEQIRKAIESGQLQAHIPATKKQPALFAISVVVIGADELATIASIMNDGTWRYPLGQKIEPDAVMQLAYTKDPISKRRFYQMLGLDIGSPQFEIGERCYRRAERQNECGTICDLRDDPIKGLMVRVLWIGNPRLYRETGANYHAPKRTWLKASALALVH
jgi:hypothetical protein